MNNWNDVVKLMEVKRVSSGSIISEHKYNRYTVQNAVFRQSMDKAIRSGDLPGREQPP
jgi:hypothetical protein